MALLMIMIGGYRKRQYVSPAVLASIVLAIMLVGATGTKAAPKEIFGIFERFSSFAATEFSAILGVYLFFQI